MKNGEPITVVKNGVEPRLVAGMTAEVRRIYGTTVVSFYVSNTPVYTAGPYYELNEGVTWIRGHYTPDSLEGLALLSAYALRTV